MNTPQKSKQTQRSDPKTMLTALKLTTTIGAVSLTLAGWGLLSRAEAVSASQAAQTTTTEIAAGALTGTSSSFTGVTNTSISSESMESARRRATATPTALAANATAEAAGSVSLPTATAQPKATATTAPTATPEATEAPVAKVKLNVVQWVENQNGDPIAVVRDNSGVLWYVWGDDVSRIEQGLDPEYQPVAVNSVGRSTGS